MQTSHGAQSGNNDFAGRYRIFKLAWDLASLLASLETTVFFAKLQCFRQMEVVYVHWVIDVFCSCNTAQVRSKTTVSIIQHVATAAATECCLRARRKPDKAFRARRQRHGKPRHCCGLAQVSAESAREGGVVAQYKEVAQSDTAGVVLPAMLRRSPESSKHVKQHCAGATRTRRSNASRDPSAQPLPPNCKLHTLRRVTRGAVIFLSAATSAVSLGIQCWQRTVDARARAGAGRGGPCATVFQASPAPYRFAVHA